MRPTPPLATVRLLAAVALLSSCSLVGRAQIGSTPPESEPAVAPVQATLVVDPQPHRVVQVFPTRPKSGARPRRLPRRELGFPAPFAASTTEPKKLTVHFFDVGQGDATAIQCPDDNVVLIDIGGAKRGAAAPLRFKRDDATALLEGLEALPGGGKKLHAVFITHPDRDHYNGLGEILGEDVQVDKLFVAGELGEYKKEADDYVEEPGEQKVRLRAYDWLHKRQQQRVALPSDFAGEQRLDITCEGVEFHLLAANLAAPSEASDADRRNTQGVVLWVEHGEADFVFAADATLETKKRIRSAVGAKVLDAEVLKVAHHGADNTLDNDWLGAVNPWIAMISARPGHQYGHPRVDVLDALKRTTKAAEDHDITGYALGGSSGPVAKSQADWRTTAIFNVGEIGTTTIVSDGETLTVTYTDEAGKPREAVSEPLPEPSEDPGGETGSADEPASEPPVYCGNVCKRSKDLIPCYFSTPANKHGKRNVACVREGSATAKLCPIQKHYADEHALFEKCVE